MAHKTLTTSCADCIVHVLYCMCSTGLTIVMLQGKIELLVLLIHSLFMKSQTYLLVILTDLGHFSKMGIQDYLRL